MATTQRFVYTSLDPTIRPLKKQRQCHVEPNMETEVRREHARHSRSQLDVNQSEYIGARTEHTIPSQGFDADILVKKCVKHLPVQAINAPPVAALTVSFCQKKIYLKTIR